MKILHVMAGGKHGGAETACIDMVIAMQEAGHETMLVTRENPRNERLKEHDIPFQTLRFGGTADILSSLRLKRIIKNFQPGIVLTWMARAASKTPRWQASMDIPEYKVVSRLGGYYTLKYFKNTDYFTTITPAIKDYLCEKGIAPGSIRHISNFAEVEKAQSKINRATYDTPADAPLVLGLGRLHHAKAFDILIKAVSEIPGLYLWIAGEGPERGNLETLITELSCADRVKLLGWQTDRAALFDQSDLCVFNSRYEPFGTVFVQSWAQKTPVIVSDADGPRQFAEHKKDCLMVPRDDVKALKAAVETMLSEEKLRQKCVKNGYNKYQSSFTKDVCVSHYINFFDEILNDAERPEQ